jgi:hypothetical protein
MNERKQGEQVVFDLNDKCTNIKGKVCGVVGPVIIVELTEALKGYEYTHIYILDAQIKNEKPA